MQTQLRKWMPIAICCLPGVTIAVIVGIVMAMGGALGSVFNATTGFGLILLGLLVCPLSMAWIMWRMQKRGAIGKSAGMAACCLPDQDSSQNAEKFSLSPSTKSIRTTQEKYPDAT